MNTKQKGSLMFGLGFLILIFGFYVFYIIETWDYSTFVCSIAHNLQNVTYFLSLVITLFFGCFVGLLLGEV